MAVIVSEEYQEDQGLIEWEDGPFIVVIKRHTHPSVVSHKGKKKRKGSNSRPLSLSRTTGMRGQPSF
jgi:hypothetical protein